jgi:nucleotide-binding universal stress UspA family protein
MAYKTILTILTDSAEVAHTLDAATRIAAEHQAHLDVLSLGLDRLQIGYSYIGAAVALAQASMERANEDAAALDAAAKARLTNQDVLWASEGVVAQMGGISPLVAMRARVSDLVLLPHPYGKGKPPEAETVLESALFDGAAPVLLLPEGKLPDRIGRRVVIAWNEGREAMAAVRAAMPYLKSAEMVDIVIVDPPASSPDRSDPGGALCQMLVRHGCKAEVSVLARTMTRTCDILKRHMRDRDADLLVMGAYGHSRLREAITGGATRDMLEEAETPVLLAH